MAGTFNLPGGGTYEPSGKDAAVDPRRPPLPADRNRTVYTVICKTPGTSRAVPGQKYALKLLWDREGDAAHLAAQVRREVTAPRRAREQPGKPGETARRHVTDVLADGEVNLDRSDYDIAHAIVMEYVEVSLEEVLEGKPGRLPPETACRLVTTLADAVAACHADPSDPVVHRDLSLSNIRLQPCEVGDPGSCKIGDRYYVPMLIDFGSARVTVDTSGTRSVATELAATAPFMAPELFAPEGRRPTEAVDVYALGVILYRILTGGFPIEPANAQNTTQRLPIAITTDRLLHCADERLAARLDRVCYHCLRKAAGKRPRADQLAEALRDVDAGHDPRHAPDVTEVMREADEEEFQPELRKSRQDRRLREKELELRRRKHVGQRRISALLAVVVVVVVWGLWAVREARNAAQLDRARLLLDSGMTEVRAGDPGFGAILIGQSLKQAPPGAGEYHAAARRAAAAARAAVHPLQEIIPGSGLVRAAPVWLPHGPTRPSPDALVLLPDQQGQIRRLELNGRGVAVGRPTRVPAADPDEQRTRMLKSLTAAAISPDGKRFAVASSANLVTMFDTEKSDKPLWERPVPDPRGLAFTPDGNDLWVAGRGDQTTSLTCHDPATGTPRRSLKSDKLNAVAISGDGRWLAAGGPGEGRIQVWNLTGGPPATPAYTMTASGAVFCLAFRPTRTPEDHTMLVSGDAGNEVRFWDIEAKQEVGPPIPHHAQVRVVTFSPDGRWLLTGAEDNTARVWDADSRLPVGHRLWHAAEVRAGAFTHDRLVTVDFRGEARIWRFNPDGGDVVLRHPAPLRDATFNAGGDRVLTGCTDTPGAPGAARVWRSDGRPEKLLPQGAETLVVRFHPTRASVAATGDNRGSVNVWDLSSDQAPRRPANNPTGPIPLKNPGGLIRGIAFGGPDNGRYLAYVGQHNKDKPKDPTGPFVYDLDGKQESGKKKEPVALNHAADSFGWTVAFTPNQLGLVSDGGAAAEAWRFNAAESIWRPFRKGLSGQPERPRPAAKAEQSGNEPDVIGSVVSPVVRPDGVDVLVWDEQQHATIYGLKYDAPGPPVSRRLIPPGADGSSTPAHAAKITGAAFTPDGKTLVTAAADGQVILWDVTAQPKVAATIQHGSPVLAVAMHRDGNILATGTQDGLVRLWSVPGAKWLGHFRSHRGPVIRVAFDGAGQTVLSASHDRTVRLFHIPTADPAASVSSEGIIAQIEADTGVSVVVSQPGADAAFGPPRVLTRDEWVARRRSAGVATE